MPVETLTFRADISNLRKELGKVPGITEGEAKRMVIALERQLKKAEQSAKKSARASAKAWKQQTAAAQGLLQSVTPLPGIFSSLPGPLGAAAVALGSVATATYKIADANSKWVDETLNMADSVGLQSDTVVALGAALEAGGQSISSAQTGMASFSKTLDDAQTGSAAAAEKFARLGVRVKDAYGNARTADAVFRDTIDALAKMDTGASKAGATMDLFGARGSRFVAALAGGSKSLDEWGAAAEAAGAKVDEGAMRASEEMDAAMAKLNLQITGVSSTIGEMLTPNAVAMIDVFTGMVSVMDDVAEGLHMVGTAAKWITVTPGLLGLVWDAFRDGEQIIDATGDQMSQLGDEIARVTASADTQVADLIASEKEYRERQEEGARRARSAEAEREKAFRAQMADVAALRAIREGAAASQRTDIEAAIVARNRELDKLDELIEKHRQEAEIVQEAQAARLEVIEATELQISALREAESERRIAAARAEAETELAERTRVWEADKAMKAQQAREAEMLAETVRASWEATASDAAGVFGELAGMVSDKSRSAALALFNIQKGLRIGEILMDTQRAATAALLPPPVGLGPVSGVALAGTIAAVGAAKAGIVAAEQPRFHTGRAGVGPRLSPDEQTAVVRRDERQLTPQGVRALGGHAAVDAANQGRGAGGPMAVQIVLSNRVVDQMLYDAGKRPSPLDVRNSKSGRVMPYRRT